MLLSLLLPPREIGVRCSISPLPFKGSSQYLHESDSAFLIFLTSLRITKTVEYRCQPQRCKRSISCALTLNSLLRLQAISGVLATNGTTGGLRDCHVGCRNAVMVVPVLVVVGLSQ